MMVTESFSFGSYRRLTALRSKRQRLPALSGITAEQSLPVWQTERTLRSRDVGHVFNVPVNGRQIMPASQSYKLSLRSRAGTLKTCPTFRNYLLSAHQLFRFLPSPNQPRIVWSFALHGQQGLVQ